MTPLDAHHRMVETCRPRVFEARQFDQAPGREAGKFAGGFDEWLRGPAHRAALDAHDRMQMACGIQVHKQKMGGWNK